MLRRARTRWRSLFRDVLLLMSGTFLGVCVASLLGYVGYSSQVSCSMYFHGRSLPLRYDSKNHSSHPDAFRSTQHQVDKSQSRPKYLKEEIEIREPLYIGVVTTTSFLKSRAIDINATWGYKASKLEYFVAEGYHYEGARSLPVVSLKGVDDSYPPQKKVYRMLQYMHKHYIDNFNWFFRSDDDVYIRIPKLLQFLSTLDPTVPLYIGSPGLGRPEDLERIKLLPHERYCMGGPGVVFSRALLMQVVPYLDDCLENVVVSYNEDLEVGRCISRRLGIQCTWAYEMRKLFYMDYSKGEIFKTSKIYRDKTFTSAITAHPFKTSDMLHRVHQFFLEIDIITNDKTGTNLRKELEKIQQKTGKIKAFP